jgi:hypothetical protein
MLPRMRRAIADWILATSVGVLSAACGSDSNGTASSGTAGSASGGAAGSAVSQGGSAVNASGSSSGGTASGGGAASSSRPAGWLYTDGSQLKLSDGKGSGSAWVGRGVNLDDIFFCGYNNTLWMPDGGGELQKVVEALVSGWRRVGPHPATPDSA